MNLQNDALSEYLNARGLNRSHQGKVRDTYYLDEEKLLVAASDRISIFDFVLNAIIPHKGEVLTALTHFWLTQVLEDFDSHLVDSEKFLDMNAAYDLTQGDFPDLPLSRCLVVKNLTGRIYPFEMIFRHHLEGSVFKEYEMTGKAGGNELPSGLAKWVKLDEPLFTPSTKEEVGHDININGEYFYLEMAERGLKKEAHGVVMMLKQAYSKAYSYAKNRGVLILDTKMEVAGMTIADEIFTPDSSRYVFENDWKEAMEKGREPQFLDKEPVRDWGRKVETPFYVDGKQIIGINKLDPENPEHVEFVHSLDVPEEIIEDTTVRYAELFEILTGSSLLEYQMEVMGVDG